MREECKNIKRLLYELYPTEKFYIRIPYGMNKNELIQYLYKYTIGICIFSKGEYGAISSSGNSSVIIPSTNEVFDMDMVEFIEIEQMKD